MRILTTKGSEAIAGGYGPQGQVAREEEDGAVMVASSRSIRLVGRRQPQQAPKKTNLGRWIQCNNSVLIPDCADRAAEIPARYFVHTRTSSDTLKKSLKLIMAMARRSRVCHTRGPVA